MKNLYKWAGLILAAFLACGTITACDDDDEEAVEDVTGSTDDGSTSDDGTSEGDEGTSEGDEGTSEGDEGTSDEGTSDDDDTPAASDSISVSPSSISAETAGGTYTIAISTDYEWSIYALDADDSWITLSATSGTGSAEISAVVAANTTEYSRSVSYTISESTNNTSCSLTISQAGAVSESGSFTVSVESLSVPTEGSTIDDEGYADVYFYVNVTGTSIVPTVTCDQSAFTVSGSDPYGNESGGYDYLYNVVAAANETDADITGTITISLGGSTATIAVTQAAAVTGTVLTYTNSTFASAMSSLNSYTSTTNISNSYGEWLNLEYTASTRDVYLVVYDCKWYVGLSTKWLTFTENSEFYFEVDEWDSEANDGAGQWTPKQIKMVEFFFLDSSSTYTAEGSYATPTDETGGTMTYESSNAIGSSEFCSWIWKGEAGNPTFTAGADAPLYAIRITYDPDTDAEAGDDSGIEVLSHRK